VVGDRPRQHAPVQALLKPRRNRKRYAQDFSNRIDTVVNIVVF
jgi:hypothetical protein